MIQGGADTPEILAELRALNFLLTEYDLSVTGTNWTTGFAVGIPYLTNKQWHMKFNISGSLSVAAASLTLTVAGVEFTSNRQAIAFSNASTTGNMVQGITGSADGTLNMTLSVAHSAFYCSGDVVLNKKPDFLS